MIRSWRSRAGGSSSRLFVLGVGLLPALYLLVASCIFPRPYYLHIPGEDLQHNYYYNALLLNSGHPISAHDTFHPGTPIYFFSSFLYSRSGASPDSPQRFFNLAYLIVAVISTASFVFFIRLSLERNPLPIALFTAACLIAWPPFLTYLDEYGSTSYLMPLALVSSALLWSMFDRGKSPSSWTRALLGVMLGLSLAVKLIFMPFVIAVLVSTVLNSIVYSIRCRRSFALSVITPCSAILSFIFFTLPISPRLPDFIRAAFSRASPDLFSSAFLVSVKTSLLSLFLDARPFLLAFLIPVVLLIVSALERRNPTTSAAQIRDFDILSAWVFVGSLFFGFIFTAAFVHEHAPNGVGHSFRNVTPAVLFLPYSALLVFEGRRRRHKEVSPKRTAFRKHALVSLSLCIIMFSIIDQLHRRQRSIDGRVDRIARTKTALEGYATPGTRIAIYDDEDRGGLLGEISFHLYGSYNYAGNVFDVMNLQRFPRYAYFHLREVDRIYENEKLGSSSTAEAELTSPAGQGQKSALDISRRNIFQKRWLIFSQPSWKTTNELVAGERLGIKISVIAFTTETMTARMQKTTLSELLGLIRKRFGECEVAMESIEGNQWCIISIIPPF